MVAKPLPTGLVALALVGFVSACDSKSPTAPAASTPAAQSSCAFTVGDAPSQMPASGGEFTVPVTTAAGCAWTAAAAAEFISVNGPASGNGSGSVKFNVSSNGGSSRTGAVMVAGRSLAIVQAPAGDQTCEFEVSPTELTMSPAGGAVSVVVTATSGVACTRTATSNSSFVNVTSGSSGVGSGDVVLNVGTNNAGQARIGSATVAGHAVTLLQDAPAATPCAFSVSPLQTTISATTRSVTVTVTNTTGTNCAWIAIAQTGGLGISGSSSGTGSGQVQFVVPTNGVTTPRTFMATVAGQQVRIDQEAATIPCLFTITPSTQYYAPAGGTTLTVSVVNTQGVNCSWTAVANTATNWATVISGSSGTGNGTVRIDIAANTGPERGGHAKIAGLTLGLQQEAGQTCGFSVTPASVSIGPDLQFVRVNVTNTQGQYCQWTATPSAPWLYFLGSSILTGYGTAYFDVVASRNTGAARTATLNIEGHSVTINQGGLSMPANAAAVISFVSDTGDYVGGGQTRSATYVGPQQFQAIITSSQAVTVSSAIGTEPQFSFSVQAPAGPLLANTLYDHAQRGPFQTAAQPGLDFGFDHRGCNRVTGRFAVGQFVTDSNGVLQKFHASFEQHCEGSSAAVRGSIWIDMQGSTTPPAAPQLPAPSGATTLFTYQSDPLDVLGSGGSGNFSLANANFTPYAEASKLTVTIRPNAGGSPYGLIFKAPAGQPLVPGTYDPVSGDSGSSGAALQLIGFGNCLTVTGKFTLSEFTYGTNGDLYTFRATFELRCASGPAPLATFRGDLRLMADPWR